MELQKPSPSSVRWEPGKRPNTFVVGAPKCGTTALCTYLSQHPNVFMSEPKEPHYFVGEEMPGKARAFAKEERYARVFSAVQSEHKVVAEGAVWYLYSQTALRNIRDFNPDARIVVMVRRPDEMVYSMHNMAVVNFSEDILDFDMAWKTALAGNKRSSWSSRCDERSKLDYHRIAFFSEQLERVYNYFPKDQVKVVFYDDFKSDTDKCFQEVLVFLGLESWKVPLDKVNESKVVVNRALGWFLRKPPPSVMAFAGLLKKVLGREKLGWRSRLDSINTRVQSRQPINPTTRTEIISHYRKDIVQLGQMFGRDLSHWLK